MNPDTVNNLATLASAIQQITVNNPNVRLGLTSDHRLVTSTNHRQEPCSLSTTTVQSTY